VITDCGINASFEASTIYDMTYILAETTVEDANLGEISGDITF
jgi:hypothetical protein